MQIKKQPCFAYHPITFWLLATAAAILPLDGVVQTAQAAAGDLDQAFDRRGKITTDFNGTTDIAYAVALQPDGRIVVVGRPTRTTIIRKRTLPSPATTLTVRSTSPLV
jgi:hypothetical protein